MPSSSFHDIAEAAVARGLLVRGGFHPGPDDAVPGDPATVILIGNAGPDLWQAFENRTEDTLDTWTEKTVAAIATQFNARALFPFDGPPHWPFQRWAQRCEPVFPAPIGSLIHPEYGLWHAYRAALLFDTPIDLPARNDAPNPCETCADKPCLTTCPVGAFKPDAYDVPVCLDHIAASQGEDCLGHGCAARRACPIGRDYIYAPAQDIRARPGPVSYAGVSHPGQTARIASIPRNGWT
ncbi:MAG: ferredoxin [Rhodospirillaceae bacterium]|jgi:hypothetical protein